MKKEGVRPGLIVYTCLIQTCIRCEQVNLAHQIYTDMKNQGIKADQVTFNTLLQGWASQHSRCLPEWPQSVLSLLQDLATTGFSLDYHTSSALISFTPPGCQERSAILQIVSNLPRPLQSRQQAQPVLQASTMKVESTPFYPRKSKADKENQEPRVV